MGFPWRTRTAPSAVSLPTGSARAAAAAVGMSAARRASAPASSATASASSKVPLDSTAKRREVRRRAEPLAEVTGERAHVVSLGHVHRERDPRLLRWIRSAGRHDLDRAGHDRSRREIHRLPCPREIVAPAAVDVDGRVRGRHLRGAGDFGGERVRDPWCARERPGARRAELVAQPAGHVRRGRHLSLGVERVGRAPEARLRDVALVVRRQVGPELGRLADQHDEHAGRHRIERACVAHAPRAKQAPHPRHHVVARHPAGLIDDEDALDLPVGGRSRAPSRLVGGRSRAPSRLGPHPNQTDFLPATMRSSIAWMVARTRSARRPTRMSSSAASGP